MYRNIIPIYTDKNNIEKIVSVSDSSIKLWRLNYNWYPIVFAIKNKIQNKKIILQNTLKFLPLEMECIKSQVNTNVYCAVVLKHTEDITSLVVATSDKSIKLLNLITGEFIKCISNSLGKAVCRLINFIDTIDSTKNFIVSGSLDGTIKTWNVLEGQCLKTLPGHKDLVSSLAQINNLIASGGGNEDRLIKLWDPYTGGLVKTLSGHGYNISSIIKIEWDKDDQTIASSSFDHTIKIWNSHTQECIKTLSDHTASVRLVFQIKALNLNNIILSASYDYTVKIWNIETGQCLTNWVCPNTSWITCLVQMKSFCNSINILFGASDKTLSYVNFYLNH